MGGNDAKVAEKAFQKPLVFIAAFLPEPLFNAIRKDFHHRFYTVSDTVYVCMLKGRSDHILLKNAKHGAPRGWYVMFSAAGKLIRMSGFLPKFSNDERQEAFDLAVFGDLSKPETITITISVKVSGQLMMVTVVDGELQVFGKNSYNTESTLEFKAIFQEWLDAHPKKAEVLGLLEKNTMCAEVILRSDRMHGYCAKGRDYFYATALSRNITSDNKKGDRITWAPVDTFNEVCTEFGIPRAWSTTVSGAKAVELMGRIDSMRDVMCLPTLNEILAENGIEKIPDEEHIDGEKIVEGLVITGNNGTRIKYKFPGYTMWTMLLRTMFSRDGMTNRGDLLSQEFITKLDEYANRWVVTSEGRKHWIAVGKAIAVLMSDAEFHAKVIDGKPISLHLRIQDELERKGIDMFDYASVSNIADKFKVAPTPILVVITGVVGSGKSYLAKHHGIKHIVDGDDISSLPNTLCGGNERNDATIHAIAEEFATGADIVKVSCGGGFLLGGPRKNQQVTIIEKLKQLLGWTPSMVYLEMSRKLAQAGGNVCEFNSEWADSLENLGDPRAYTSRVVAARDEERKMTNIYQGVIKRNFGVLKILRKGTYPKYLVPAHLYDGEDVIPDFTPIHPHLIQALGKGKVTELNVQQVRIIAEYAGGKRGRTCGHFTCDFSFKRMADPAPAVAAREKLDDKITCSRVKITQVGDVDKPVQMEFLFTENPVLQAVTGDRIPHVTINSGVFKPVVTGAAVKALLAAEAGAPFDVTGPLRRERKSQTITFKVTSVKEEVVTLGGVVCV